MSGDITLQLRDPVSAALATSERAGVAGFTPYVMVQRENVRAKSLADPLPACVASANQHALVQPAALLRLMGDLAVAPLDRELPTQSTGADQNMLLSRAPFLVQYYGTDNACSVAGPVPTQRTKDVHALVQPDELAVEDCYFRMLVPREIGAAMAFPDTYVVLGKKGEQVKQYGNAVTPPAMALLIERVVESLHPERTRRFA